MSLVLGKIWNVFKMAPAWYFSVVLICWWRRIKFARMMFTYERVSHMLIKYWIFIRQFKVEQLKSFGGKKKMHQTSEDQSKQRWSQMAFRTLSVCPSLWTTLFTCLWFHFEASLSITLKATVFVSHFFSPAKEVIHYLQDNSIHTRTQMQMPCTYTFCLLLFSEWAIHLSECLFTLPLALESPLFMGSSKPITECNMVGTFYCVTCLAERVNVLFKAKNEQRL